MGINLIEFKNLGLFSISKSSIYLKVLLNFLATQMSVRTNFFKKKGKDPQSEVHIWYPLGYQWLAEKPLILHGYK